MVLDQSTIGIQNSVRIYHFASLDVIGSPVMF